MRASFTDFSLRWIDSEVAALRERWGRAAAGGAAERESDGPVSRASTSELYERVLERDELADLDAPARRLALRELAGSNDAPGLRASHLADEIDGYGPLTADMEDPMVTDVLVTGPNEVWVERAGELVRSGARFEGPDALASFVERMLAYEGRRADASYPIADSRLPDGSRIHVVLPPVAPEGPLVSIRRFPKRSLTLDDLVARGAMTESQADLLRDAVTARVGVVVSGGTGSGKTTLLNALLGLVTTERVIVIEETPELRPSCVHVVRLVARDPNVEGRGGVGLDDLVRAALRMRPDRIVVGEVRGPEALPALAAMSVGHEGSMITVHARSAAKVFDRLVSLALLASSGATEAALHAQARAAVGLVVHLERARGTRHVAELVEVP